MSDYFIYYFYFRQTQIGSAFTWKLGPSLPLSSLPPPSSLLPPLSSLCLVWCVKVMEKKMVFAVLENIFASLPSFLEFFLN
jgi:hypothetical protein